jgi:hypothetical protein
MTDYHGHRTSLERWEVSLCFVYYFNKNNSSNSMVNQDVHNSIMVSRILMIEYRFLINFSRKIKPNHLFTVTQASLGSAKGMEICSSLLMCCDEDESTTNQISRTAGSILMCDTQKSLTIRLERIPDATVPIGTVLDLLQASCEDGKGNFRNCPMMMLTGNAISQPISPGFGQCNIRIAST